MKIPRESPAWTRKIRTLAALGVVAACGTGRNADGGAEVAEGPAEDPLPSLIVETVISEASGFEYGPGEQADLLPDGGVVFADRQAGALHLFSPEGRYQRSIGRRGEGPGEFDALVDVEVGPNGELAGADFASMRVTVFDADGALTHTLRTPFPAGRPRIHWSEAGLFLHVPSRASIGNESAPVQGVFRAEMEPGAEAGGTAAARFVSWFHPAYDTRLDGDSVTCGGCPVLAGPNGGIAMASPRPLYRVIEFDTAGAPLARWEKPQADTIWIPEEEREAFRSRMQLFYDQLGGTWTGEPERIRAPLRLPSDIGFDATGRMWTLPMQTERDAVRPLEVFGDDGTFLGQVELPVPPGWRTVDAGGVGFAPLTLRIRGDRMLVVAQDEWDLPVMVVYRIQG